MKQCEKNLKNCKESTNIRGIVVQDMRCIIFSYCCNNIRDKTKGLTNNNINDKTKGLINIDIKARTISLTNSNIGTSGLKNSKIKT